MARFSIVTSGTNIIYTTQGTWDAGTNIPFLINPDITKAGYVYQVIGPGSRFGHNFLIGDLLIYDSFGVANKFSDTNYSHPLGDGNLHVIATGTTNNGKVLTAGATAGSLSWNAPIVYTLSGLGGQPLDGDLTSIAALAGLSGFLKKTAANTWALDTNIYSTDIHTNISALNLVSGTNTGDQTISLTGGVTGSGTGSFAATVVTNANLTGVVTSVGNATAIADAALSIAKTSGLQGALDLKAPASGSANYIQASPASAQSANMWIDGSVKASSLIIRKDIDGETAATIQNNSTGTGSYTIFQLTNGLSALQMFQIGSGFASGGRYIQNGSLLNASGVGGLTLSASSGDIMFWGASEAMRITNGGVILIGTTINDGVNILQVNGSGKFASSVIASSLQVNNSSSSSLLLNNVAATGKLWNFDSYADGNLYIGVSGSPNAFKLNGTSREVTFASSVQVGDNTAVASALNVGAMRYRETANASYSDKVMKVSATTYAWVNLVTNTWV